MPLCTNETLCLIDIDAASINGPTRNWKDGLEGFTAIRHIDRSPYAPPTQSFGKRLQQACSSELEMLDWVLDQIHAYDPDVIVGHNFLGFDLDVLLHRMSKTGAKLWSRLGRLQRNAMPKLQVSSTRRSPSLAITSSIADQRCCL
jgi:DNA polymerase alpha subunit A